LAYDNYLIYIKACNIENVCGGNDNYLIDISNSIGYKASKFVASTTSIAQST